MFYESFCTNARDHYSTSLLLLSYLLSGMLFFREVKTYTAERKWKLEWEQKEGYKKT